ncbi:hypothetical protein ACHAW6_013305 [Cyclotella cf. meneghiniana]
MAMKVFYRRHPVSSRLFWATFPFYSVYPANSFRSPSSISFCSSARLSHAVRVGRCLSSCDYRQMLTTSRRVLSSKQFIFLQSHRENLSDSPWFSASATSAARHMTIHNNRANVNLHYVRSAYPLSSYKTYQSTVTRLFGSNPSKSDTPGEINLSDDRDDITTLPIDMAALHKTIHAVRDIIGYPTYDISLSLIDEDYMKEVNNETRGVNSATDVLSFSFTECVEPGILAEVPPHGAFIGEMYCLGDLLICVDYVAKKCEEDRRREEKSVTGQYVEMVEGELLSEDSSTDYIENNKSEDADEDDNMYEYQDMEVEVLEEYDDRGVAPALLTTFNPEIRIHMLIVHGMLHLVGFDHIEDDDYELMVMKEDEVMAELRTRLGEDFGVGTRRALPAGNFANDGCDGFS